MLPQLKRRTPLCMRNRWPSIIALTITLSFLGLANSDARTWRVAPDGSGDAPTIQAAMDSSEVGDEVVLEPGTYTWTSQGQPWPAMVRMKAGVTLRGEEESASAVLDAELYVIGILGEDIGTARIENITIKRGFVWGAGGAGMRIQGASNPSITNCVLQDNYVAVASGSVNGGGILCQAATISRCQFIGNQIEHGNGGALWCENARVEDCTFRNNRALGDGFSSGGAVSCRNTTLRNCVFEGNAAGNVVSTKGGAVRGENVIIDSCTFLRNAADCRFGRCDGGAVYTSGTSVITNSLFIENKARDGGAIFCDQGGMIEQSTFVGNESYLPEGVGGIFMNGVGGIRSVILVLTKQGRACFGTQDVTWACSNLYGNVQGDGICGVDGGGNIAVDSEFCAIDPVGSGSVGIQEDSPCAPGNHPDGIGCGLIGAGPVACGPVGVTGSTWGAVKLLYR